jgi:hypothetical protein
MVRGLASNWYRAGADGLYFWNLGTPFEFMVGDELTEVRSRCYECLYEVGDPQALIGRDKLFCVDNVASGVLPYYSHISSPRQLPIESKHGIIRTGVIGRLPLMVGDDLASHTPTCATLTVDFRDASWTDALLVRLNGEELHSSKLNPGPDNQTESQLNYLVEVPTLKTGHNYVEIGARNDVELPDTVMMITGVQLKIDYA